MKKTVFFTPKDGKFNFEKPEFFKRLPSMLKEVRHLMTITEFRNIRSLQQNSYMWGVVYDTISKDTGYTPNEIHQLMGQQFLAYEKKEGAFMKSTTDLNTKEFEDYLENVRRFASMELGIYIPLPNEPDNFYYETKK